MCALCAQANKTPGGWGCLSVSNAPSADKFDAGRDGVSAPSEDSSGNVGQNPGAGGDTVPGGTGTAFTLSNDLSVRGYINVSGEQDWYRVTLTAGQQYTFFMNGFGVGAIRDPFVRLYDSNGVQVLKTNGTTISGLGHGGPYNGSATYGVDNVYANDSWHLSIMSYMDQLDANSGSYRFIMTPAMADILAVQGYYGAPITRPGDTIYGFNSNAAFTNLAGSPNLYNFAAYSQAPAFTIYDGSGTDTLDASGYSNNQLIDLRGGNFSNIGGLTGNIGIYTSTVIETGIGGSGNDTIIGNSANNTLRGNGGNDTISGGDGSDTITGGAGNDTIDGGDGFDIASWVSETSALTLNLTNQALNAGSAAGDNVSNAQAFYLTDFADSFTAGTAGLFIYGFAGNDTIHGSGQLDFIDGGAGADTIDAGGGFDYVSYNSSTGPVTANLNSPAGSTGDAAGDTIVNAEAYILTEQDDTLIGATNGQNVGFGYGGNDTLVGGFSANNWLVGGNGNDRLVGGGISDLFSGDAGADTIVLTTPTPVAGSSVFGFAAGVDAIEIARATFGLSAGYAVTAGSTFAAGTSPANTVASPTFLYYTDSGLMYFDPDGTGATAATLLMQFAGAPALAASDFHLV
jgi:serralysin